MELLSNKSDKFVEFPFKKVDSQGAWEMVQNHRSLQVIWHSERKAVLESINRGQPLLLEGRGYPLSRGMVELLGVIKERMVPK